MLQKERSRLRALCTACGTLLFMPSAPQALACKVHVSMCACMCLRTFQLKSHMMLERANPFGIGSAADTQDKHVLQMAASLCSHVRPVAHLICLPFAILKIHDSKLIKFSRLSNLS